MSLLSLISGAALALLAAQSQRGRWIDLLMSVPFLTPPFLGSLAWSLAVGTKGYLRPIWTVFGRPLEQLIFSFWGLSLLMAVHYAPIVYFAVRAQIEKIPSSLLWAGQIAGAAPGRIVGRILLPITFPALLAGGFLAFACGIEEYGTPLVIGNRIGFPVIATEIGRIVRVYPINLTFASALASMLFTSGRRGLLLELLFTARSQGDNENQLPCRAEFAFRLRPALGLWMFRGALFSLHAGDSVRRHAADLAFETGERRPGLWQFDFGALSLGADRRVQRSERGVGGELCARADGGAARNSSRRRVCARSGVALASLALIPAATPAITMAVGFIRGWNATWTAWLPLYGSTVIVGIFYTAQYLPYAVQYARAGLATIPSSYEWAARIHGAGPGITTRRIVAPLLWPHCLAGAILIFSISFRELVGSVLLRPPGMQTVSTFILREFDQGSPATGMAMGVIAIAVSLLSISLARRLVPKKP